VARRDDRDRERLRAFGGHIRTLREQRGLTQEQLAEAANVHRAEVGFVERSEREVGITLVWRLADGLGLSLSEVSAGL
jgi:transcriptional regulator with XRE-family HTH domain